ncbi:type IV secretion system protein [Roseateles saccharophilus]|uniref:Type IV secretion system protein VirB6 n=1 Tax=Roseateles saccharophilus TaxID=304 RepID=A0A4V2VPC2_ROSSA|nr:type IV secretion system protein [Roseateles saccharophilus]MDG0834857.1 type IV secretion system protein [Roseateles saccharophilus]TCU88391.1 type IV secretion system protein VirB6 [Roseateles saccharophilus]
MFTWVGAQFDIVLNGYVVDVVTALMRAIAPIALTTMTLWIALYGWAVLRNEVSETVPAFMWKVFKIGMVLAFALQSGFYVSNVVETANALGTGVATTFLPPSADATTISGPYVLLDAFNDKASQLVLDLLKDAGITRPDLLFAAAATSIANVIFLCLALFVVTLAKVFLTFTLAVGPLFILCLAWRPTARFFDSWLSMLLNSVVLAWFAFFALGLSSFMGGSLVKAIQDQGGFQGPTFNVVAESLKYCIVMILMAILCFQAPSLASALTGGTAIQQGVQMIQNALTVSRHLTKTGAGHATGPGAQGGVVRAGVGLPFMAGKATATAAAGAASAARYGYRTARTAAYKLAAMRGRI